MSLQPEGPGAVHEKNWHRGERGHSAHRGTKEMEASSKNETTDPPQQRVVLRKRRTRDRGKKLTISCRKGENAKQD